MRFGQLRLFHRADDTDNREQFRFVRLVAVSQTLTQRAAIRPVTPGEFLVDDADPLRTVRISRGKEPSFAQRNAERREVIAVDAVGVMTVQ